MNTDSRVTLPANGTFHKQVLELFEQKQKAGILYEDHGVTRANGIITAVFEKDGKQWMQLDNSLDIEIDKLYALNGIFASDYSEC